MAIGFNQQSWSGGGMPDLAGVMRAAALNREQTDQKLAQGARWIGGGVGGAISGGMGGGMGAGAGAAAGGMAGGMAGSAAGGMAGGMAGLAGGAAGGAAGGMAGMGGGGGMSVLGGKNNALKGFISGAAAEANPQFAEDAKEVKALRVLVEKYGNEMGIPDAKDWAQTRGLGELRGAVQGFAFKQQVKQMQLREQEAKMRQQAMKAEAAQRKQQQHSAKAFDGMMQKLGGNPDPASFVQAIRQNPIALGDPRAKDMFGMMAAAQKSQEELAPEIDFVEDPVSGERFATYGRSLASSGINPSKVQPEQLKPLSVITRFNDNQERISKLMQQKKMMAGKPELAELFDATAIDEEIRLLQQQQSALKRFFPGTGGGSAGPDPAKEASDKAKTSRFKVLSVE